MRITSMGGSRYFRKIHLLRQAQVSPSPLSAFPFSKVVVQLQLGAKCAFSVFFAHQLSFHVYYTHSRKIENDSPLSIYQSRNDNR